MTADGTEVFRIGGEGASSPRYTAVAPHDRITLIERYLANHNRAVMILEVKRDDRSWDVWKRDLDHIEFMRVGRNGEFGAAEYLRGGTRCAGHVVQATHKGAPYPNLPWVPYDTCVPLYFPPETVVPIDIVRHLMIDFALHGAWSNSAQWRRHDHLVA